MRPRVPTNNAVLPPLMILLLLVAGCAPASPELEDRTRVFEGAWFVVSYPVDFRPRPSIESSTADGFDSVFFDSPDGEATFYLYAPQWGGEAIDIALDPDTERLAEMDTSTDGPITTTRTTITATNGAWTRSYVTEDDERGPTRWTIGWQYASETARVKYSAAFAEFQESLTQFAD
jgi:hypothetical protein